MNLKGTIKGQTVELDEPIGLPEGQRVDVAVWPEIVPIKLTPGELAIAQAEYEAMMRDSPAYRILKPLPTTGHGVTNEMVNRIRETMGF